jgi:hypothetical protein
MTEIVKKTLSEREARELTDRIRDRAEELWHMLLEAYEGGAHTALGYASWAGYVEAELGISKSRGYQLLDSGRVSRVIEAHSTIVEGPNEARSTVVERPNEAQARELAPLAKENPERAAEAWERVVEVTNGQPTAKDVKRYLGVIERTEKKGKDTKQPTDWTNTPMSEYGVTLELDADGKTTGGRVFLHGRGPAQDLMTDILSAVENAYGNAVEDDSERQARYEERGEVPVRLGRSKYKAMDSLTLADLPTVLHTLQALDEEKVSE